MKVACTNSIEKIIKWYFAGITKTEFVWKNITVVPKPLKLYPSLAYEHVCPENCGACCGKFSLDYINGERDLTGLQERIIHFNGQQIRIWRDEQCGGERCKYLRMENGRCDIHGAHPFSCDFECLRFEVGQVSNYNKLEQSHYGRTWQLTQVDGTKNVKCEFLPVSTEGAQETIRKLRKLEKWANHFHLTNTYIPEIISYLENEGWRDGAIFLFPDGFDKDTLYKKSGARYPGRETIEQMIEEGIYTRKEIQERVLQTHPEVPKSQISTWLTDVKNPNQTWLRGRQVVIVDGVWKFA
jgi:Fe-S-cluster containining protein